MAKFTAPVSHVSGFYVSKDEKAELIKQGTEFTAQAVEERAGKFTDREYVLVINLDDEERGLTFPIGSVDSRDRLLADLQLYLDQPDAEPVILKIAQVGRSHVLEVVE